MTDNDHEAKELVKWINDAMAVPFERSEDDLGIALAPAPTEAKGERLNAEYVRGFKIELIGPEPVYRPLPKPPYRCICGTVFATAQELLDHRHEPAKGTVSTWGRGP